jgi:hypothetical protein
MISVIHASPGGRMYSGMMKGTGPFGRPSTPRIRGKGSVGAIDNWRVSSARIFRMPVSSIRSRLSHGAQRRREAMQSAAVTGAPLCKVRPSRRVKRHSSPSLDPAWPSTIFG